MGSDAVAFDALHERVAELERTVARLADAVFGRDMTDEVLGEKAERPPRLEQPPRTR